MAHIFYAYFFYGGRVKAAAICLLSTGEYLICPDLTWSS